MFSLLARPTSQKIATAVQSTRLQHLTCKPSGLRRLPPALASLDKEEAGSHQLDDLSEEAIQSERRWVSGVLRMWMDEEWAPLECHETIANEVADVYMRERLVGSNDLGGVVLSIGMNLSGSDIFFDSFTDSFEVANKLSEMLMMRDGHEVCCVETGAACDLQRYTEAVLADDIV